MRTELSVETKQTFQVIGLLATVLVVAIHYQSAMPTSANVHDASYNQLLQGFLIGGVARVAVPLFAFAAGFFYFRSDDGSFKTYFNKLRQRCRTVLIPYLVIGGIAMLSWVSVRSIEGDPVPFNLAELTWTWLVHPPAEQMWFLRDLMVLVVIAPLLRMAVDKTGHAFVILVAMLWLSDWQPMPIVGGWYVLHTETLFFFTLGCAAVHRVDLLERLGRAGTFTAISMILVWIGLLIARIMLQPNFDNWYVTEYDIQSLLIQKCSILAGCLAIWSVGYRLRTPLLSRLSGAAFFVYLVHEFPLRAIVQRTAALLTSEPTSFWMITPTVVLSCFVTALLFSRYAPSVFAFVTGGRTPQSASRLTDTIRMSPNCVPYSSSIAG
ncbi:acyltransferase family protein [Novipirellula artificiosorum]|uniref:Acyltransferase family protein n=1 Tax=Novipirellula artificiosorum TaxID=2528016 RepID=A0A5C6D938_9BACT|nr:acyltransferase [Novipirellula artificiosorum]TWU33370.1 Acyltransferase family protein [Novipirellula artificiosorum]